MRGKILSAFACIGLLVLSACGGGGGGSAPGAPTSVSAAAGQGQATVSFTAPASNGGAAITSYTVISSPGNFSVSGAGSPLTVTGLTNGTAYTFTVTATNSVGTSSASTASSSVTPIVPRITTEPTAQNVTAGEVATFSVSVIGNSVLLYQWYKNSIAISGATLSSYTTPATTLADNSNTYKVVIKDGGVTLNSAEVTLTVVAPKLSYLVISEVANCYTTNTTCWFEIYNPTASPINLSGYSLISTFSRGYNASSSTTVFTFPSFNVPADGYVIVSGNLNKTIQAGTQLVQPIHSSGYYGPYWNSEGSLELYKAGITIDFVRLGDSTNAPSEASAWSGAGVVMSTGSANYGTSIVRRYPNNATIDNNTASDWTVSAWATPAGRNDITSDVDADGDGIPDSAEVSGGTYAGLDLYSLGARTSQKDIFIEVDAMDSADPAINLSAVSLQKVVDSFSAKGISVHFDAGTRFSSSFSTANFNLGQGNSTVAYEICVGLNQTTCSSNTSTRRSIYDWKSEYMDLRRRNIFHYMLMANSLNANGVGSGGGIAELPGNDIIITQARLPSQTIQQTNFIINIVASTIMHELGHNLGLRHGGDENLNDKPNYWSIMNYTYSLMGLDANAASATAYQRWRHARGDGTPASWNLTNSPFGSPSLFIMSYSDGTGINLNEGILSEAANIGRGADADAYADWNLSGTKTSGTVSRDLNGDGALTILRDYNDWGNIYYPFARSYASQNAPRMFSQENVVPLIIPMSDDRQEWAEETPIPARFIEEMRRAP